MRSRTWRIVSSLLITNMLFAACGGRSTPLATPSDAPPTPPTASASASPKLTGPAPTFQYLWVAEPHGVPGLARPANAAGMRLSGKTLELFPIVEPGPPPAAYLSSQVVVEPGGLVRLELRRDGLGCHAGDIGTYLLDLSPTARGLTAALVADPCSARSAAIVGAWTRADCPHAPQWCYGDLDPGEHVSLNYRPFGTWNEWHFDYGRFGYTVPEGWMNLEDSADGYVLGPVGGPEGAGIFVFTDPRAHKQGPECPLEAAPNIDGSARAITTWLQRLAGVTAANVHEAHVGGLQGFQLDLAIAPGWKRACPWNVGGRDVPLFMNVSHDDFELGLSGNGHMRLFVMELEPGRALIIDIEAQDESTWGGLLPVAVPIVESFEFRY